jgi:hypothetical protein
MHDGIGSVAVGIVHSRSSVDIRWAVAAAGWREEKRGKRALLRFCEGAF